jgi:hypothetical protein
MPPDPVFYYNLSGSVCSRNKILLQIDTESVLMCEITIPAPGIFLYLLYTRLLLPPHNPS